MKSTIDLNEWVGNKLFDSLPVAISVIDEDLNIVKVNKRFENQFGSWLNRKCWEVYETLESKCTECNCSKVFDDGIPRRFEDMIKNSDNKRSCLIRELYPIADESGAVSYVIEVTIDVTDKELVRQKYRNLFEHVPCDLLVINRNYEIIEGNRKSREKFGPVEGKYCFEILKNRSNRCLDCTASITFRDGIPHTGRSTVIDKNGQKTELLVTTVPYGVKNGDFDYVLEMAVDITETLDLQEELKATVSMLELLVSSSMYGIIAMDDNDNVTIVNGAAKQMLEIPSSHQLVKDDLDFIFPTGFLNEVSTSQGTVLYRDTKVCDIKGNAFPTNLTGINFSTETQNKGKAFWIHDIRRIKRLESEKIEAERLAAVGKTVAGLAHGIKNVLTGLEGGEYLLNSGLQKGDVSRIEKGLEMLNRNTNRVSTFVKEFLSFSKGQEIEVSMTDPVEIAKEVVNTYSVKINQLGIKLISKIQENIALAPLNGEGIHECLSNLLGNAIDATRISENPGNLQIIFEVYEKDNTIIFKVADNGCGMDYEVKKKVFTTFFTTKGLGGTGLGLLMTKKIVQQHGGTVDFESILDQGTTFQIALPRDKLPKLKKLE